MSSADSIYRPRFTTTGTARPPNNLPRKIDNGPLASAAKRYPA